MGPWTQFWFEARDVPRSRLRSIDERLVRVGGIVCHDRDGNPIIAADGTIEVRVLVGDPGFVRFLMAEEFGMTAVRELTHEL